MPMHNKNTPAADAAGTKQEVAGEEFPKLHTLKDGRVAAIIREPSGEEIIKGSSAAGGATDPIVLLMCVAWASVQIDDKPVTWEEFKRMSFKDILVLVGLIGGNVPSPALATSSS